MINKILVYCILLATIIGSIACSPVTSAVTEYGTITMTTTTTMTASPSTTSSTISTTIPAFFAAVGKASQDSVSVEIELSATGNEVSIKNNDPRFVELSGFLGNSALKRIMTKTVITTENGTTTTIQRTIPYAWGYVITFSLKDSSTIKFNCSIDSVWFETDQAIYETSFSDEFKSFLDTLTQQPIEVVSVSSPYKPGDTITPAGPKVEITLKNISNEPVMSLTALLIEEGRFNNPWTFNFNVTSVDPLLPGQSTNVTNILISGGFGGGIPCSLAINGTQQNGATFAFVWKPSTTSTTTATITSTIPATSTTRIITSGPTPTGPTTTPPGSWTTITINTCIPTATVTVSATITTTVVIPPSTVTVNTCIPTATSTVSSITTITVVPVTVTVTVMKTP